MSNISMDFNKIELDTISHWESINLKDKIKASRDYPDNKTFNFLDGPPFVNGKPHHGHLLVSYIKDSFARYYSSLGYKLNYQIGFDCHGLPLEQEAEKIVGKTSVLDSYDKIKLFTDTCRDIISNCSNVWYDTLERIGRQFDRDITYYTSNKNYMESLWWAFKTLFDKNLIYQSKKVMHYSPLLETPLSNFEANQNYQEITDTSVYVKFKLGKNPFFEDKDVYILAWTTTPWSLIANQGLCVNDEIDYHLIKSQDEYFIRCVENTNVHFKDYEIIDTFKGTKLNGLEYIPILEMNTNPMGFKIYSDSYVKSNGGTGVVHLAPLFGDDDLRVLNNNGYNISWLPDVVDSFVNIKYDLIINETNQKGRFIMDISPFIIQYLKQKRILFKTEKIKHSYPFCWRTDKPLVYLAVDAWFLNIQKIKEDLINNNQKINWYPSFVGSTRFDNWIKDAPDWCLSRNRIWGTPIPIWTSESGKMICIGSIEELEKYTNTTITDLHLDNLYNLIFEYNGEIYKRTLSVLDCWFESGMAGLSSVGYPECKDHSYPVDFITESLDQTRGWFYTLNVLSTALNNQPAFRNVVVSGLVLAEDGKKMSKRLQNYTTPNDLINKYGSDFVRLYLIGSPCARAESFCFKDEEIKEIAKKFIPYMNAFNMFSECLTYHKQEFGEINLDKKSDNIMDNWLINLTNKLALEIKIRMTKLEIYSIPNIIYNYWEHITNDYIKLSRDRLKNQDGKNEAENSLSTLYYALRKSVKIISPFLPFLSDHLYKKLFPEKISVHLDIYYYDESYDNDVITAFREFNNIVEAIRQLRHNYSIQRIIPLTSMIIYLKDKSFEMFSKILSKEVNVLNVSFDDMTILRKIYKPINSVIGKKFKERAGSIRKQIESGDLTNPEITEEMYSYDFAPIDVDKEKIGVFVSNNFQIYLNTEINNEIIKLAEIDSIRRLINQERKEMGLKMFNKIKINFKLNETWESLNDVLIERLRKQLSADINFVNELTSVKEIETLFNNKIQYEIIII